MKKKVLIVEDDRLLGEVYHKTLVAEGIECAVAEDARTALKLFKPNKFSIILLDVMLVGLNGFEVLKKLRQVPGADKVRVIIVTGLNTDDIGLNKELRVSLNIIGVYTKSQISIAKLVQAVKSGLENYE